MCVTITCLIVVMRVRLILYYIVVYYLSPYLIPNNHAALCKHQVFDGTENTKEEEW